MQGTGSSFHSFIDPVWGGPDTRKFEVFWIRQQFLDLVSTYPEITSAVDLMKHGWNGEGWYWWVCSPGMMPQGKPHGPFASREEAVEHAKKENPWEMKRST